MSLLKISDYMSYASVFSLMSESSQLVQMADLLDTMIKVDYGQRVCGPLIINNIDSDSGVVSEDSQQIIADVIWLKNKYKWNALINFAEDEVSEGFYNGKETAETTYGKEIKDAQSGTDSATVNTQIAGFDSTSFVDSDNEVNSTTFGKTVDTTHSGSDSTVITKISGTPEDILLVKVETWQRLGIARTVVADAVRAMALAIYE